MADLQFARWVTVVVVPNGMVVLATASSFGFKRWLSAIFR
jgi:hypothetical protein